MVSRAVIAVRSDIPTHRLMGLSLLERTILAAHQAGIQQFLIVSRGATSSDAGKLKQGERFRQRGIDIKFDDSDNHRNPLRTTDNVLILPDNCVFSPIIISKLVERNLPEGGLRLLTDNNGNFSGIALCSPDILPSLLDLARKEAGDLDLPVVKSLIQNERLSIEEAEAGRWIAVESKDDIKKARQMLLKSVRKREDGFIARYFNRPLSLTTTKLLLRFNITPAQVTIANLIIGMSAGYFIGKGGHLNSLLGGFLFQCASIFDGCDGEIARLTYQCSEFGTKLDNICDIMTLIVFLINLPIGIYSSTQNPFYLYLGVFMLLAVASIYIQMQRFIKKSRLTGSIVKIVQDIQRKGLKAQPSLLDRAASKIAFVFRNDFIKMTIFLLAAVNGRILILWILILLGPIESIYLNIYARQKMSSTSQD